MIITETELEITLLQLYSSTLTGILNYADYMVRGVLILKFAQRGGSLKNCSEIGN